MAFTSGFFNSKQGDRKYNAEQVSEIFDGVLKDGIIPSQGQLFDVNTANNGMQITVGTGRAWFDHTWSKNDSVMILTVPLSDITRPRYDAVVLEVNHDVNVRANSIKIITGVPAVNTVKPILINTDKVKQYPLAYIYVPAGSTTVNAANIENMVGRAPTVFATGVLETVAIDDLWSQWEGEWHNWFEGIKLQLSGDVVTNLQYQIDQNKSKIRALENKTEGIEVVTQVHTNVITESQVWQNTSAKTISVTVRCIGGGGGACLNGGGGGGGHMAFGTFSIPSNTRVNVTIGQGGDGYVRSPEANLTSAGNGGTTSFGTYISANGGSGSVQSTVPNPYSYTGIATVSNGGDGGTGGGSAAFTSTKRGGNGSYGGGGGGCGGNGGQSTEYKHIRYDASPGGSGGTYGGGGGGGAGGNSPDTNVLGGKGGTTSGSGCGNGGSGGDFIFGANVGKPTKAFDGTDTRSMNLDFTGTGKAGTGGSPSTSDGTVKGSGSAAGGGGYGGNGGNGCNFPVGNINSLGVNAWSGGGGGGGGGYGGAGGTATTKYGGGGGGYGGKGGNSLYSGEGCGSGGGYYGGGGGGYGKSPVSEYQKTSGSPGICIVTWVTREIIIN